MDATKAEIINQIRELNALLIQAKLHVGRSKLAHHFHRGELDSDIPELHGQGRLLGILGLNPGTSETTPRDLGYILGMSRQAVTDLLSKLEARGLIARKPSPSGAGQVSVSLTRKGREALNRMRDDDDGMPDVLDCLNEQELAQFDEYLQRIIQNAESKSSNDEFAERRRAMHEFFNLTHPDTPEEEIPLRTSHVQVERTIAEGSTR